MIKLLGAVNQSESRFTSQVFGLRRRPADLRKQSSASQARVARRLEKSLTDLLLFLIVIE